MREAVARIVNAAEITDLHTHLYPQSFGPMLLWGIDELLTYHYLAAEVLRVSKLPYDQYWTMSKREQADLVWRELFTERSPVSEACRGPLTALEKLGLDPASRDLDAYRGYFASRDLATHIDRVFTTAKVRSVVMTNDPFDQKERAVWDRGFAPDGRFHAALRIDPLLNDWETACERLASWGYNTENTLNSHTLAEVRRFLSDWINRIHALYMAVSLPPEFSFPEATPRGRLIAECVLPAAREHNMPFALMIGVKRNVNPALELAGDGVGNSMVDAVERLCADYPGNKFMVTMLARENQHALCVAARKFRNLFLFGCWWFLNTPSLIEDITRMRLELLGTSFAPQHSDARVLEQLIYKWDHTRRILSQVLADKYADLLHTGWAVKESEIARDVNRLFGDNFWEFVQ